MLKLKDAWILFIRSPKYRYVFEKTWCFEDNPHSLLQATWEVWAWWLSKPVFLVPFPGGHFFHRTSLSPRSLVYESEFSTIEPSLDMYDENKTWLFLNGLLGVTSFVIWFMITFLILYSSVSICFGRMAALSKHRLGLGVKMQSSRQGFEDSIIAQVTWWHQKPAQSWLLNMGPNKLGCLQRRGGPGVNVTLQTCLNNHMLSMSGWRWHF